MRSKLLIVCGPTATGKTRLALHLAQKFKGELISADSRMVYKYMDIGTGKDIKGIAGYDLVLPNEQFSVSEYLRFATNTIKKIIDSKKLPILVGGTGLYIKAVVDGIETENIMPDQILRENLKDKSADVLFKILKNTDRTRAEKMNESDRKNPRRLVRAIEIANSKSEQNKNIFIRYEPLFVGLTANKEELKKRIDKRVEKRIEHGFEKEINFLKEKGYWNGAPSVTLGYKDWPDIDRWKLEEFKYAKRQLTWFKKDKRINWFKVTDQNYQKDVENLVQKWYSN